MIVENFILVFVVWLGSFLGWHLASGQTLLKISLAFAGAFILGISTTHLLPVVYKDPTYMTGIYVLLGFLLQLLLEFFSQGIEHGHIHTKDEHISTTTILQIVIGLSIHSFLEGMPLAGSTHIHTAEEMVTYWDLLWTLLIHKIPAAIALGMLLKSGRLSKNMAISAIFVFSIMTPLGSWVGEQMSLTMAEYRNLLAVVTGSLFHISTTILFESDKSGEHGLCWNKILAITAGLVASILI